MIYYKYIIEHPMELAEALIGRLSQLPFEALEEKEACIEAWLPETENGEEMALDLAAIDQYIPIQWKIEKVEPQNWNEQWESGFHPIVVDEFCQVRADFHQKRDDLPYDLIINPRMAFGTAHHETTYMMLSQMSEMNWKGKSVLDLGCGTGVLAILARMMGATDVLAIDIDIYSYENTLENLESNQLTGVQTQCGTLRNVDHSPFDVILANINRSVILDNLSALHAMLKAGGILLVSGILKSDAELVISAAKSQHFTQQHIKEKNGWICVFFLKDN
jgi:ribosomal protein L11 methyltransferase